MITHYPGNMDYGEKVTGRKTTYGGQSEGAKTFLIRKVDVTWKKVDCCDFNKEKKKKLN